MAERKQFRMPDVGEGLTEAEIVEWHVRAGDQVSVHQTIVEIETAKARVELPCPYDGSVGEVLVEEGQTVAVGTPIVTFDVAGEPAAAEPAGSAAPSEPEEERTPTLVGYGPRATRARRRPRKQEVGAVPAGRAAGAESDVRAEPRTRAEPPGRAEPASPPSQHISVLAKPPVRKLAKDLGVDLARVTGTGPGGTITRSDVEAAYGPAPGAAGPAVPGAAGPPVPGAAVPAAAPATEPREERIPIRGVRKNMASAMVSSALSAPQASAFLTVDASETMRMVDRLQRLPDFEGLKLGPLLFVAKALLLAVRARPLANSTWDDDAQEIVIKRYVNLGIAVATERGLIVPNIKGAEALSLPQLAAGLQNLVTTARDGKTAVADLQGGTATITNVGVFGIDAGTPLLNPGEAVILGVGAIRERPWVHDGSVVPRQAVTLSLAFDHRIVDGELASTFLSDIGAMISDPTIMLARS